MNIIKTHLKILQKYMPVIIFSASTPRTLKHAHLGGRLNEKPVCLPQTFSDSEVFLDVYFVLPQAV